MDLLVNFILIVGILLNIFVLVGLIRLKNKKLPQQILIFYWIFVLINILHSYTALHSLWNLNRITFIFEDGSRFILAPIMFLYFKSLFFEDENFVKRNLVHLIPFLVYFLVYTIPRLVNILNEPDVFTYLYTIYRYINMALVKDLFFIWYCYLSLRLFYRAKNTMKHHYSHIKEKDFSWLEIFLLSMTAVIGVDLIITLSEIFFKYDVSWDGYITLTFLIIAMVVLGYNGLKQSTIFLPYFLLQELPKNKRQAVTLASEPSQELKMNIEEALKSSQIYLDPNLTLGMLANKTNLTERKLSAFLNNEMQVSFYDLINSYRIAEAKKRLVSGEFDKFTIEGLGHSCGFKSRSSFFKLFKKETGVSPSTFKKTGGE